MKNKFLYVLLMCITLVMILTCCNQNSNLVESNSSGVNETIEKREILESEIVEETSEIETKTLETTTIPETTIVEVSVEQNDNLKDKLQRFVSANTIDRILSYYLSFRYTEYGLNNQGVKTTYYEGYQDIQNNEAIRIKNNLYNTEYPFEKIPYYVRSKKGSWAEVIKDDSSPLPTSHFLRDESIKNKDVINIIYGRNSIIDDRGEVLDINDSHVIMQYPKDIIIKTDEIRNYYENILGIKDIDYFIYDYEYDKNTLVVLSKMEIAVTSDGSDYNISNTTYSYDVNILPSIKVVNDEDGEAVYFDTKKLEKANTYNKIKKDIVSLVLEDKKYDINGKITKDISMYKDEDGNVVVKEVNVKENGDDIKNPIYRVKFEKIWFDVIKNKVYPSSLTAEQIQKYEVDPVSFMTGNTSLIDNQEKTVMSFEDKGTGVIILEDNMLSDIKRYNAEVLPSIPNVIKTRRKLVYDMDDDIVKNWTLSSYTIDGQCYKIEDFEVKLDANEPKELNIVMDYVEEMRENDD